MNDTIDLNDCWLFACELSPQGYGVVPAYNRKKFVHRVMYEEYIGDIPEGFQIDHLCRVRSCVNPEHLEAVTPRVNVLRSSGIAAVNARKTHCIRGHEFTPQNTYLYGKEKSKRACKACGSLRADTDEGRERRRITGLKWYYEHRERSLAYSRNRYRIKRNKELDKIKELLE